MKNSLDLPCEKHFKETGMKQQEEIGRNTFRQKSVFYGLSEMKQKKKEKLRLWEQMKEELKNQKGEGLLVASNPIRKL